MQNYKDFWDDKASTTTGAFIAVDGSANEQVLALTGAYSARQITAALDLGRADRVLELGCGVGRIGGLLAPGIAHWEGADISANMLGVARKRLAAQANVGFTELVRTSLRPLPDAGFDKAYSVAVFIHMDKEDFYLYLEELARVVKPGGLVYFDTWNLVSRVGWRRFAIEAAQYRSADFSVRKDVARNQFSTPDEVRAFLEHAGFEVLLILADSPWVQVVAQRRGAGDVAVQRERVNALAKRIAYTPLWTELFDTLLKVTTEGMSPHDALAMMNDASLGDEVPMFRAWFIEMWRANETNWGKAPAN
ncbi:MAG: class I SAM-dependent methyltransferase [Proteobacteria bacterium]|nr:class I SAM-dependent methyltransferase [Pseudomonadota bacterium]